MKKVVLTIRDEVCTQNGKDVNAKELLEVMTHWGTVEDFDDVVKGLKSEYQTAIDGIAAQLAAIKDQHLTQDEFAIVDAYRKQRAANEAKLNAKIDEYAHQLTCVKTENENMIAKIRAVLGE